MFFVIVHKYFSIKCVAYYNLLCYHIHTRGIHMRIIKIKQFLKEKSKEFYTARINQNIRLFIRPVGEYPYNIIDIIELEFVSIDDSHYGEG